MKENNILPLPTDNGELYSLLDYLDDERARTLSGYLHYDNKAEIRRVCHLLVNDPPHWNTEKDGPVPLFLHYIDVEPEYDAFWSIALDHLANYAREKGYHSILTTGKSTTHSEQAVEDHLLAAGFKKLNYRRYWLDL